MKKDRGMDTARDREMGRGGQPLGDRGRGNETWTPPRGEQGISNRPDDEASLRGLTGEDEEEFEDVEDEFDEEGDGFEDDDGSSGRSA